MHRAPHLVKVVSPAVRTEDRRSASERGYGWPWAKAAKGHLRNSPLCVGCQAMGRVEVAVLVDHVEPHRGDTLKFWDRTKWQSSCKWHHDVVKQRLEHLFDRGRIKASDLWLNSPVAVALANDLQRG